MDKQSGKKISVRVNGSEKDFKHEESLSHTEEQDSSFPWVLPENETRPKEEKNIVDFQEFRNRTKKPRMKMKSMKVNALKKRTMPTPPSLRKMLIPAIAILVGLGLGLSVLSFMTSENGGFVKQQAAQPAQEEAVKASAPASVATTQKTTAIPELSLYMVQGGAFSTEKSAEKMAETFQAKGQPAVVFTDASPMLLFVGAAMNEAEAKALGQKIKDGGADVYVKAFTVSGSEEANVAKEDVTAIHDTFTSFITLSSNVLTSETVSSEEIKQASALLEKWKDNAQKYPFYKNVQSASTYLEKFAKQQSPYDAYAAQQELIQGIKSYEKWVAEQNNKKA
ncbi:SPOR domain-containing protein [Bacillus tianshenii]|nr:SPOR domain-containing protein [Bacillus tianshenii]